MSRFSVRRRYLATLVTNLFNLLTGVANSLLVPRALGPSAYGSYQFLSRSFISILGFSNMSISNAFFTRSSRDSQSANALVVFAAWMALQAALVALVVVSAVFLGVRTWLFPQQLSLYIVMVAISEWMNYTATNCIQFGESKAESVFVQRIALAASLLKLAVTVSLFCAQRLTLVSFIIVNYIGSLATVLSVCGFFFRSENRAQYFGGLQAAEVRSCIRYFVSYCSPLVIYEAAGLLYNYFDRWFLLISAGAIQQGLFSLSFQWSTVVLLFTNSMSNIAWRETSLSFGRGDADRVRNIYLRIFRLILTVSACLAAFLACEARVIISLFLNGKFAGAAGITQIMAFYPIFTAVSALNATFFYATEQVKTYRNITVLNMAAGILATYALAAPANFALPGLGLGAIGVALKNVLIPFLLVVVQTVYIAQFLEVGFAELLKDFCCALAPATASGTLAWLCLMAFGPLKWLGFVISSFVLFAGTLAFILWDPERFGLMREELRLDKLLAAKAA